VIKVIELKKITKIYKSKKGQDTVALQNINLKLGNKGLTFILGKSGSGKSTLLNILGGLDTYTSGELIINNKRTKDFKESDFETYRNTYIGFVFQEFNLLDNYTVYDNIKLALELQGKKPTKEEVLKVLKDVDLENVIKRKPNELSGGQKQRVSIARALIKNPEVILADEPTGNLDSATSTQIFEILKEISKEKLVIIVSHDEESAKKYADRIIRIKDGEIESDSNDNKDTNDYEIHDVTLRKAKLPFFYSFKMGIYSLFHKKIRLVFSIIIISLCLICFGLMMSASNFNDNKEYINQVKDKTPLMVEIQNFGEYVSYEEAEMKAFTNIFSGKEFEYPTKKEISEEIASQVEKNTNLKWSKVYEMFNSNEQLRWQFATNESTSIYYFNYYMDIIEYDDNIIRDSLIGRKPSNEFEIVINKYLADHLIHFGIEAKKEVNSNASTFNYKPTSYDNIINDNNYLKISDNLYLKVVGIIDTDLKEFAPLKEVKETEYFDLDASSARYNEINKLDSDLSDKVISDKLMSIYVHNDFITSMKKKANYLSRTPSVLISNNLTINADTFGYLINDLKVYNETEELRNTNLQDNEVVITTSILNEITNNDYEIKLEEFLLTNNDEATFLKSYLQNNNIIESNIKTNVGTNKIYNDISNYKDRTIKGVVIDNNKQIYFSKNEVKDLIKDSITISSLIRIINNMDEMDQVLKYYPINHGEILSFSKYSYDILGCTSVSYIFRTMGKFGTIFFFIFASILLMNFINTSIKFRKKEIGILKALGCKSIDVFKMFIYESLFLLIVSLVITYLIVPNVVVMMNEMIQKFAYIKINTFHFGVVEALSIAMIMLSITIIANIIPLRRVTKMKPIDTILDK